MIVDWLERKIDWLLLLALGRQASAVYLYTGYWIHRPSFNPHFIWHRSQLGRSVATWSSFLICSLQFVKVSRCLDARRDDG